MPELDLDDGRRPERVVEEFLSPAPGHLDRLANRLGQPGGLDRLRVPRLAAEPAADKRRDDAHLRAGRPIASAISSLRSKRVLGRSPNGRLVPFDVGQGGMGLDGGMGLVAVRVGLLDDLAGELSAFRKVPALGHQLSLAAVALSRWSKMVLSSTVGSAAPRTPP